MGYLHQGHISLVREAQHHSDLIVVSIYVNPGQFSPTEDLSTYPSNFRGDIEQLMAIPGGVDVVFHPHNLYHYGPTNESVDSDGDKGLDRKGTGVVSCVEDSGFGHETWVRVENLEKGYVCVISLLGKLNRAQLVKYSSNILLSKFLFSIISILVDLIMWKEISSSVFTIRIKLKSNSYFGMEPKQVKLLKHEKVACLVDNEARLALDPQNKYRIQTKLHGHVDTSKLLLFLSKVCNPNVTQLAILLPQQSSYLKTKTWLLPFNVGLDYLCRTLHLNISCSFHPICLTLWGALVQDISEKLSEVTENNPIIMGTKMIVQTKRAPTYPYSPNSSAAKREYVKNNEVTDLVKQLKPTKVF
ncbi:hypothetical protein G4B88_025489 [Cannabis sativa]|uniref:Pantoate--beta-alanine ligase n=1 Tax=Cannabis sativa TaxID=3483 RepID=A0A7J6FCK7_CANSA|nr:hypothetical protein G4B88_025489 [Cannabis sativa]